MADPEVDRNPEAGHRQIGVEPAGDRTGELQGGRHDRRPVLGELHLIAAPDDAEQRFGALGFER